MKLDTYIRIATALEGFLRPMGEVVIHDLATDKVVFIAGNFSKRCVGDPSLLNTTEDFSKIDQNVFLKRDAQGRWIKCVSIPLEEDGCIRALMCINYDISMFAQMQRFAEAWIPPLKNQPAALFQKDWKERVNRIVCIEMDQRGWLPATVTQAQKKTLAELLFKYGAFKEKNAVDHVAEVLGVSRATLFKYLKEWRNYA